MRQGSVGRRVLFLNWRDLHNPLGGGSERYLHRVASGLAARGAHVTVRTAAYPGAAPEELLDGVRYVRGGSPNTVFPQALLDVRRRRFGPVDVVVDCQNGVPFWTRASVRVPVVVLVHHVHREQWRVAVGPVAGRVGWLLESRVAPFVYRRCQYVAVSPTTRRQLVELGVGAERIAVVHNGVDTAPTAPAPARRCPQPMLAVVSRLVPHKRVEQAVEVLARLLPDWPGLRLTVVGDGYWRPQIRRRVEQLGLSNRVSLLGHVDEATKHAVLASSWLHLCPSLKEGWGLAIMEAARHGVPTIAYRDAGGTVDSVLHEQTGLLADSATDGVAGLTALTGRLLADAALRERLSRAAQLYSAQFTWERATEAFSRVLDAAIAGRRVAAEPVDLPAGEPQRTPY